MRVLSPWSWSAVVRGLCSSQASTSVQHIRLGPPEPSSGITIGRNHAHPAVSDPSTLMQTHAYCMHTHAYCMHTHAYCMHTLAYSCILMHTHAYCVRSSAQVSSFGRLVTPYLRRQPTSALNLRLGRKYTSRVPLPRAHCTCIFYIKTTDTHTSRADHIQMHALEHTKTHYERPN